MKSMKKNNKMIAKQLTAIGISAILVGSVPVFALENYKIAENYQVVDSYSALKQLATSATVEKEETVYGILNSDGAPSKVIVSNFIKSDEKMDTLTIDSTLENLRNLQKEEMPEINGSQVTWNVDGYELNYQGTSTQTLPVETIITYYLDDTQMTAKELEGKSGQLKIVIEQVNNQFEEVVLSGKTQKLYVPYYSLATMKMTSENFTNVKINQGKVISDGKSFLVTGLLAPGMKENFEGILDLDIQNQLEITAEVTNFEFKPIYMAMSNKLPEVDAIEALDQLSNLSASLTEFKEAGEALSIGATEFEVGQATYFEKLGGAVKGLQDYLTSINSLSTQLKGLVAPVEQLKSGITSLHDGLLTWQNSAKPLVDGYAQFSEGTKSFAEGAKVIGEKVSLLSDSLGKVSANASLLSASSDQLSKGLTTISTNLTAISGGNEKVYAAMKQFQMTLDPKSENYAAYEAILKQMETVKNSTATVATGMSTLSTKATEFNAGMSAFAQKTTALSDAPKLISEGANKLNAASGSLIENAAKLQAGTTQLVSGMTGLVGGSEKLVAGMSQLNQGILKMGANLPTLDAATGKLSNGFHELDTNSVKLTDAAKKLKEGIVKFNEEGIKAMVDKLSVEGDKVDLAVEIKDALELLSEKNNSFSGTNDDMTSKVDYIFKITDKATE